MDRTGQSSSMPCQPRAGDVCAGATRSAGPGLRSAPTASRACGLKFDQAHARRRVADAAAGPYPRRHLIGDAGHMKEPVTLDQSDWRAAPIDVAGETVFAIGDVHGCSRHLDLLLGEFGKLA